MPDWNSNTNPDSNANTHTHPDADAHTNPDTYAYPDTGADHAARAWLQSARPANGGPLLEWADLG